MSLVTYAGVQALCLRHVQSICFSGGPIIGLVITAVILHITWESWHTISTTDPGEMLDDEQH